MAVAAHIDHMISQLCPTGFCHRNISEHYRSSSTSHVKSPWNACFLGAVTLLSHVDGGSRAAEALFAAQCIPHHSPTRPGLWFCRAAPAWVRFTQGGSCLSLSMSPFAEEQHLRSGSSLEPCRSWNACGLESSAAHSRLSLDPALPIPTPSDFESEDWVCAVQLQTWKKNGVTNVGQLPMHHSTGNLAEQPFSFTHLST